MSGDDESAPNGGGSFEFLNGTSSEEGAPDVDRLPGGTDEVSRQRGQETPPRVQGSARSMRSAGGTAVHASRLMPLLVGYCVVLTGLLAWLFFTGRATVTPAHPLESLPDLRPLQENEFRAVPPDAELPVGHTLGLGETRRFGDVRVTPVRVTREPLQFAGFLSGEVDESLQSPAVLKLWLEFRNVADDYAFPPLDAELIASRSPRDGQDDETLANSFLMCRMPDGEKPERVLNYLHLPESNFRIVGQNAGQVIQPSESFRVCVASAEIPALLRSDADAECVWRIQIRKGVSQAGTGVTTLVDVAFPSSRIDDDDNREN